MFSQSCLFWVRRAGVCVCVFVKFCSDHSVNLMKEVKNRRGSTHGYHCEVGFCRCAAPGYVVQLLTMLIFLHIFSRFSGTPAS